MSISEPFNTNKCGVSTNIQAFHSISLGTDGVTHDLTCGSEGNFDVGSDGSEFGINRNNM